MNFCADFGASDEIRLTPIEDDKPKDAENSKFKASSDYLATANRTVRAAYARDRGQPLFG